MPGPTREQRALVRDWIAQGALPGAAQAMPVPVLGPVGMILMLTLVVLGGAAALRRRSR
jgi:hypothetical protein